jgi:hypothetical protein
MVRDDDGIDAVLRREGRVLTGHDALEDELLTWSPEALTKAHVARDH